jgi:hypothetical protein
MTSWSGGLKPPFYYVGGYKPPLPGKIFRTAAQSRCQIKQVKAIRAAARFLYLLFLRVRCPNPFFVASLPDLAADDSVIFS